MEDFENIDSTANFSYEGNAKINLLKPQESIDEFEIVSIENLIPIQVVCRMGGNEVRIGGYMDYSKNQAHIPPSSIQGIVDEKVFEEKLVAHLKQRQSPMEPSNQDNGDVEHAQRLVESYGSTQKLRDMASSLRPENDSFLNDGESS